MSQIPSIDIGPFLHDPTSPQVEKVVQDVRAACKSTGFFRIYNHGISREVQQRAFDAAARFFALPFDDKKKLDMSSGVGNRGYDALASQAYGDGILPDLKESYLIGIDVQPDNPRHGRLFMGPNRWPPRALLAQGEFQDPCETYYRAITGLSRQVLQLVARTLPYGPHVFDNFVANDPMTPLRLLHYPPIGEHHDDRDDGDGGRRRQFSASPHTDFGAITLLLQDGNPGLEVRDPRDGASWTPVDPSPGAYVVNLGDMLPLWTRGEYRSSVHRVVNRGAVDRYSIAYFLHGNLDFPLAPLDGRGGEDGPCTVGEHMRKRVVESYAKKQG